MVKNTEEKFQIRDKCVQNL